MPIIWKKVEMAILNYLWYAETLTKMVGLRLTWRKCTSIWGRLAIMKWDELKLHDGNWKWAFYPLMKSKFIIVAPLWEMEKVLGTWNVVEISSYPTKDLYSKRFNNCSSLWKQLFLAPTLWQPFFLVSQVLLRKGACQTPRTFSQSG